MKDKDAFASQFSEKLKYLRHEKSISLEGLSEKTGINQNKLKEYEEGASLPDIGELLNLATSLGVQSGYFFASKLDDAKVEIVRESERWKMERFTEAANSNQYNYEALSYHMSEKLMLPFIITIPGSEMATQTPSSHEGEEFLYVLEGSIELEIDGKNHSLDKGDSIYFDSRAKHTVRGKDNNSAKLLACVVNTHQERTDENPLMRKF